MSTKHKLLACIPHGDPDLGAEIECEIAFSFTRGRPAVMYLRNGDPGYPADPDAVDFIDAAPMCNGKPRAFDGAYADLERKWLNDLAEDWLASDDGQQAAIDAALADDERAREYAAELRRGR